MKHQNCIKCGHQFTYKEKFYACQRNFIYCKDCGSTFKITFFSRVLLFFLVFGFFLLEKRICKFYDIPSVVSIIIILSIFLFLFPAFVRFNLKPKNKEIQNKDQNES